ncbi:MULTISPECIES: hypothetical protein [Streptomyces]|uniref:HNH endonuclease n=1 Tax=Streptomyces caniscabiei TaxID=2746961 RepID=A0ABU4MKA0_9ACTN|nr:MULTISPECIES: hypothetical protein [Streptomyces]MBE4790972.1 hypothetical protein [Streptomyces caniscabiei]MDX3009599.1 hypothetical protein [Streptomyces caniscabiei]MDX3037244.1 hypothetical protein [Streptomyces caniscabiei]MDX3634289.1 hypothetical protein [Streptomyces europaeiscabiei]MDX3651863.1 hypothetical protein [Streptomyces europaeiscabiei]
MARLPKRTRADHPQIAAQLFANPGAWGTVSVYPSRQSAFGIAGAIRRAEGTFTVYGPSGYFETRLNAVPDGTLVEARYIGRDRAPKSRSAQDASPETERAPRRNESREIRSGPDAARAIEARHEAAYGDVWHGAPASPDEDALWAEAITAITRPARGARRKPIAHGEVKGASQHRYRGEPLCEECRAAVNAYQRQYQRSRRAQNGAS